jgi:hypothetical protein
MLDTVRPRALDVDRIKVTFDDNGLDVDLPHAVDDEWLIYAMVGVNGAIVGTGLAHEHFEGDDDARPWPVVAVDFVAELLRGQVEVERVYRGETQIVARRYLVDASGERHRLGSTRPLTPGRLMFWKPTCTERFRIDFDAEN